jgi:UDP-N-acetylmuramoyl-L-alanyl-D-glutamate--2,6-diaminopimelate ligase
VVFADDPWGARLVAEAVVPVVAVHRSQALDLELEVGRTAFTWRGLRVTTRLTGAVNVDNALVAAEAAVALGLDPNVVAAGLAAAVRVPGRLEPVSGPDGSEVSVLVDYAHTPAALEAVLAEGRRLLGGTGRLVVVFGCGGERDQAKRPVMGAVASAGADVAVVTTDNPRSEGPLAIIDQILDGVPPGALADRLVLVEPERHRAIDRAVALAEPGDLVLVAGKGHETYQEADGVRRAFDDRLEASAALERHHRAPGV